MLCSAAQLCLSFCDTMDCSPSVSSVGKSPWNFPGKNTGVRYYFLLQRIFLTEGGNPHVLHLLALAGDSLPLSHLGSPLYSILHDKT